MIQTINRGAAAGDGTGDKLRDAWGKANANFSSTAAKVMPAANLMPVLTFDGTSKASENKRTAANARAMGHLAVEIGPNFGVNGTNAEAMNTDPRRAATRDALKALVDAGNIVIHVIDGFFNDSVLADATISQLLKYRRDVLLPAGVHLTVITGIEMATNSTAVSVRRRNALRQRLEQLVRAYPDLCFIDTESILLDPNSANGLHQANANAIGDPFHKHFKGEWDAAIPLLAGLRQIVSRRPPVNMSRMQGYGAESLAGNLAGPSARTTALGGTLRNVNLPGQVTGTPPAGWTADIRLSGTAAVAFTTRNLVIDRDDLAIPRGVWPVVNVAFSGATGGTGGQVLIFCAPSYTPPVVAGTPIRAGAIIHANDWAGWSGIEHRNGFNFANVIEYSTRLNPLLGTDAGQTITRPYSGPISLFSDVIYPKDDSSGAFHELYLILGNDVAQSGSVDFVLPSYTHTLTPLPAAAA